MQSWSLSHDAWGRLVLTDGAGKRHEGVEPLRAFPLSEPARWVAILDANGHELAFVENLHSLSAETRSMLEAELARREFVPNIARVVQIRGETPTCRWTVETDRGRVEFVVAEDDHVRRMGGGRVLVIDSRGMRYLIPDITRLDAASQRALEPFV